MSFSSTYGINFVGSNYVTPAAEQVVYELQGVKQAVAEVGATSQQMGAMSFAGFRSLIFGAQMGLFYFSMMESGMLRSESATIGVELAQERLNVAIQKYGPSSAEANRAMQQLERTQLYYQRVATYTQIITVSMGLQMVGFAAQVWHTVIPSLSALTTQLHTAASAMITFLSLHPLGWLAIAGGVAAAAAATYALTRPVELPTTLNINNRSDIDQVLEDYKRRLKRAITQSGVP
jgi:hypothetical protein